MTPDVAGWKRCSTCKTPLVFATTYWACNVSTCNRANTALAFCSVDCWDAHLPLLRHREAWAEEKRGPRREEWERQQREVEAAAARREERSARPVAVTRPSTAAAVDGPAPHEVLVIASRLKAYVRARAGMSTSDAVLDVLSERLRALADESIRRARTAGRLTILDRDVP